MNNVELEPTAVSVGQRNIRRLADSITSYVLMAEKLHFGKKNNRRITQTMCLFDTEKKTEYINRILSQFIVSCNTIVYE